jgi:hypothetical protein
MKMIMKWEDLEPGDKVKINEEFYSLVYEKGWINSNMDIKNKKELTITNILKSENYLIVYLYGPSSSNLLFHINFDGTLVGRSYQTPLFEIIELKEKL